MPRGKEMLNLLSGKSEIKGSLQPCSCSEGNTECFNQQSLARIPGGEISHWMLPVHPLHQQECILAVPDAGAQASRTEEHPKQSTGQTQVSVGHSATFVGSQVTQSTCHLIQNAWSP